MKIFFKLVLISLVSISSRDVLASSSAYNGVTPVDAAPISLSTLKTSILPWITSGYSALVAPWEKMASIPDSALAGIRAKVFGGTINDGSKALTTNEQTIYRDVLALPATVFDAVAASVEGRNQNVLRSTYGGYNQNVPSVSGVFIGGTFMGDADAIQRGIKTGAFNNINYWRLVLTEYLVGRLYMAVSPFKASAVLNTTYTDGSSDTTIINNFLTQAAQLLAQTRYLRTAFGIPASLAKATASSATTASQPSASVATAATNKATASASNLFSAKPTKNTASSSTANNTSMNSSILRPIDTFAGVVVINNVPGAQLGTMTNPIEYRSAGFIPSGEYVNYWQNSNKDSAANWYIERTVRYGGEGAADAAYVSVAQKGTSLVFSTDYNPQDFLMTSTSVPGSVDAFNAFFSETTPWAFVVLCQAGTSVDGGSITVITQTVGLVKLNSLLFAKSPISDTDINNKRNGAMVVKGNANNASFASSPSSASGSNYELTDIWYAPQNLYSLTYPNNFPDGNPYPYAYLFLQGIFNGYLQTSKYQALVGDGAIDSITDSISDNQVPRAIYTHNRWNAPTVNQWLAADSYLDWFFLRSLVVSYYAGSMMYVNDAAFGFDATNKKTYLEEIFASPKTDIPNVYIGGSDDNVSYVPVLPLPAIFAAKAMDAVAAAQTLFNGLNSAIADAQAINGTSSTQKVLNDFAMVKAAVTAALSSSQAAKTANEAGAALTNAQEVFVRAKSLQESIQKEITAAKVTSARNAATAITQAQAAIVAAQKAIAQAQAQGQGATLTDVLVRIGSYQGSLQSMAPVVSRIATTLTEAQTGIASVVQTADQAVSIASDTQKELQNAATLAAQLAAEKAAALAAQLPAEKAAKLDAPVTPTVDITLAPKPTPTPAKVPPKITIKKVVAPVKALPVISLSSSKKKK